MFKKRVLTGSAVRAVVAKTGVRLSAQDVTTRGGHTGSSSSSSSGKSSSQTQSQAAAHRVRPHTAQPSGVLAGAAAASSSSSSSSSLSSASNTRVRARPLVAVAVPPAPPPLPEEESFAQILDAIRRSTEPLADLDETIVAAPPQHPHNVEENDEDNTKTSEEKKKEEKEQPGLVSEAQPVSVITHRTMMASLACPKKFYLYQYRPDLTPRSGIGDVVHFDDTVGFNELARRWDRLQFGSKATLIDEADFAAAVQRTEQVIVHYFNTTYKSLGEQAPSLTLHRPAFAAPFGHSERSNPQAAYPMLLRARPCVLRYRPKDNQWVLLEASATVDPLGNGARAADALLRLHFTTLAFRYWITQPHIPIAIRKRFLNIDLATITAENAKGHVLESSAEVAAPIDLKRSGLLHIRQFCPGPATLFDCDPSRLVRFVQRLSLEDMLELDRKHSESRTGAFDMPHLSDMGAAVRAVRAQLTPAQEQAGRFGGSNVRSTRSIKQKELGEHQLFAAQQRLLEAILQHHTLKLVRQAQDAQQVARWTSFSLDSPAGLVRSTLDDTADDKNSSNSQDDEMGGNKKSVGKRANGRGRPRKKPQAPDTSLLSCVPHVMPCFSEHLGAHCSRGEVCPFFTEGLCLPQRVTDALMTRDNHLFTLPSSPVTRKVVWWAEGMRTVRDLLHQYKAGQVKLTAPQLRYVKAVAEGCVAVNRHAIQDFFAKIRYPAFLIDFEAVQFALPPFQKELAYQSVPFQFSLDVFQDDILTETPTHYDFLHFGKGYSPNVDPRKPCIDELMRIVQLERGKKRAAMERSGELARIAAAEAEARARQEAEVGKAGKSGGRGRPRKNKAAGAAAAPTSSAASAKAGRGSAPESPATPYDGCFIAHYASFEKSCLERLGQLEEQYKEEIKQFFFLDTMDLFRKGFIHPNAHGSNSLKKVLPAMCPDFQYGVFGSEDGAGLDLAAANNNTTSSTIGPSAVHSSNQDEQRGENAMGLYRLWYHQEGGGTMQDLQRTRTPPALSSSSSSSFSTISSVRVPTSPLGTQRGITPELRDKAWATLRIQLLEYCSLDTKALYEIMRRMWQESEAVKDVAPMDKSGWVFVTPSAREMSV